ncbi:hypothetical protein HYX17_03165 [Candidatus Woesearchaeota archaeon]|nr:hypothetical protein [Candidatus Woesearchaeota archaeon]
MIKKFIFLLICLILINMLNSYSYITDYPIDCDDSNPNIYPGAKEICDDNIDNNCNVNNGYEFDTNPNTGVDKDDIECCSLVSALWSANKVSKGNNVTLTVTGKSACNSLLLNFIVKEDDLFPNPDDDVARNPENANFKNDKAESSWIAEFQNDGIGNPEYYFTASTGLLSIISSPPMLEVTESIIECGDNNLDQGENCFTCPDDAGCNLGQICLNVGSDWACVSPQDGGCPQGQTLCSDNTCKSDCGANFVCDKDGICESENKESCSCSDCDTNRDFCSDSLVCDSLTTKTCQIDCDNDKIPDNRDKCTTTCPNPQIGPVDSNGCSIQGEGCPQNQVWCGTTNKCISDINECPNPPNNQNNKCESELGESCLIKDCDGNRDFCSSNLICDSLTTKTCQIDCDNDKIPDNRDKCTTTCPNPQIGPVDSNGCSIGSAKCGNGILELGETCKTCSQDLPSGFCDNCKNNNICDTGENCLCGECTNLQGSCIKGNVCNIQGVCIPNPNDGLCTNDKSAKKYDPECCSIIKANWLTNIATTNSLVDLSVEGDEYCEGRQVNFKVYEDDLAGQDDYVSPDPQSKIFSNKKAKSSWSIVNVDDGLLQGEPEFYFNASSGISSKTSNLLNVIACGEDDSDCDGVKNENDKCPDTPLEEINNVDEFGCAPGESSCVAEWDCTNALWTECNEQGYRTRDINKCTYTGNNLLCESKYRPLARQSCLIEESFPVFTFSNLIITILILLTYYIIFRIKK